MTLVMARYLVFAAVVGGFAAPAEATLVNLGANSFTPAASVITFDTPGVNGSTNPVYNFTGLAGLGNETVSFGGYFKGQSLTGGFPESLTGSPTGPLSLTTNNDAPVFITNDGASPTNPVLSGSPTFNGPISILFSTPVAAVGLTGGYFDNPHSTSIEAFDKNGNSLGILSNNVTGFEFYGLFDPNGPAIAGLSFFVTGNEPAGFEIDNVTFGNANVIVAVPEPASLAVLGLGLAMLAVYRRRHFM